MKTIGIEENKKEINPRKTLAIVIAVILAIVTIVLTILYAVNKEFRAVGMVQKYRLLVGWNARC